MRRGEGEGSHAPGVDVRPARRRPARRRESCCDGCGWDSGTPMTGGTDGSGGGGCWAATGAWAHRGSGLPKCRVDVGTTESSRRLPGPSCTRHERSQGGSRAPAWARNDGVRRRGIRRYAWAAGGAGGAHLPVARGAQMKCLTATAALEEALPPPAATGNRTPTSGGCFAARGAQPVARGRSSSAQTGLLGDDALVAMMPEKAGSQTCARAAQGEVGWTGSDM